MSAMSRRRKVLRALGWSALAVLSLWLSFTFWQCFAGTVMFR